MSIIHHVLFQLVLSCHTSLSYVFKTDEKISIFIGFVAGRVVMTERKETGPTRPCHIREAYRRLKLKGKVPLRSRPRLFKKEINALNFFKLYATGFSLQEWSILCLCFLCPPCILSYRLQQHVQVTSKSLHNILHYIDILIYIPINCKTSVLLVSSIRHIEDITQSLPILF